jgi:hypothetical protein
MSKQPQPLIGLFQLDLFASNNMPGSTSFHMALLVHPSDESVTGFVEISAALGPKYPNSKVYVTGTYQELVFGGTVTKVLVLNGDYVYSFPPPAIGSALLKFNAVIHLDSNWDGTGNYTWGFNQKESNVPTNQVLVNA